MRKIVTSHLLALLLAAPGWAQLAPQEEEKLNAAAEASRSALLSFQIQRPGLAADELISYRGFYISADGLAVVPLQAFDSGQFAATNESDQSPVSVEGIVAAATSYGFAIVRTNQRNTKFLVLGLRESVAGDQVSILRPKEAGGSLAAPIVAVRKAPVVRSQEYLEVFSIGANLGDQGILHVPAGTPVFDGDGLVAGALYPPALNGNQRFLFAAPISAIGKLLPPDTNAAASIPLPLPPAFQPADPLANDPTYLQGRSAQLTGDIVRSERLLRRALINEPKSASAWQRLGFVLRERRKDEEAVEAFGKAVEFGNHLSTFVLSQADQLSLMGKSEAATAYLAAACKKTPFDYDLHRAYAVALRAAGDEQSAEKHLRLAVELAPDSLSAWTLLSKCLAGQSKWDEEKLAADKIYELDSLYRPR